MLARFTASLMNYGRYYRRARGCDGFDGTVIHGWLVDDGRARMTGMHRPDRGGGLVGVCSCAMTMETDGATEPRATGCSAAHTEHARHHCHRDRPPTCCWPIGTARDLEDPADLIASRPAARHRAAPATRHNPSAAAGHDRRAPGACPARSTTRTAASSRASTTPARTGTGIGARNEWSRPRAACVSASSLVPCSSARSMSESRAPEARKAAWGRGAWAARAIPQPIRAARLLRAAVAALARRHPGAVSRRSIAK